MVVENKTTKIKVGRKKEKLPTITVPPGCNLITHFEELAKTKNYTTKMCDRLVSRGNTSIEKSSNYGSDGEKFVVKYKEKPALMVQVDDGTDPKILVTSLNYALILKDSDKSLVRKDCTICRLKEAGNKEICLRSALVDAVLNL